MARLLITAGPTREYIDPVRYLTNGSSGRMGAAVSCEALQRGHQVAVVTGPVQVAYPDGAEVFPVITTSEMLAACQDRFGTCDCLIGIAAPCDYRPTVFSSVKLAKQGRGLRLELEETSDILATLAADKSHQKIVGFSLETHDHQARALAKLKRKKCDLIAVNDASAVNADESSLVVLNADGQIVAQASGTKRQLAAALMGAIEPLIG